VVPYQIVRSKMDKTRVMLADPQLACYIPETVYYSPQNLARMLSAYALVYVKPDRGRGGERVISIRRSGGEVFQIHFETKILPNQTLKEAVSFVARIAAGSRFIIQQGIEVLQIDKRPCDLRVNIQKPYGRWEVTGLLAKMGPPGKVVTNYCQGGTLVPFKEALQRAGFNTGKISKMEKLLVYLAERAAAVLNKIYPGLRELGVDVALDRGSRPWILEVNTCPQYPRGNPLVDRYHRIIVRKYLHP
jgi:glutathione synthase/RimK-type ligase-like ATP-grasp enzyme